MNYAPMLDCPSCGKEIEVDDYYDMDKGAEIECPSCNTMLVCESVEMLMSWSWRPKDLSAPKTCRHHWAELGDGFVCTECGETWDGTGAVTSTRGTHD